MVDTFGSLLLSISWQLITLFFLILIFEKIFNNQSSLFKYFIWLIIPVRLCVPFTFHYSLGILSKISYPVILLFRGYANELPANELITFLAGQHETISGTISTNVFPSLSTTYILVLAWGAVVIVLLTRYLIAAFKMKRKIKSLERVSDSSIISLLNHLKHDLGITNQIDLLLLNGDGTYSPMVTGLFRPKVLLPEFLLSNSDIEKLRPILLHELVHIKRGDLLVNFVLSWIQIFYFFHPVVWIVSSKILTISEDVCDDLTILYSEGGRKTYFQGLLSVLEKINEERTLFPVGAYYMERKTSLSKRIIRLTHPNYSYFRPLSRFSVLLIASVCLISVVLSCDSVVGVDGLDDTTNTFSARFDYNNKVHLHVYKNGVYSVDNELVDVEGIEDLLRNKMLENNSTLLSVVVEDGVTAESLSKIYDIAYGLGFRGVSQVSATDLPQEVEQDEN